jgi:hypothetical protein
MMGSGVMRGVCVRPVVGRRGSALHGDAYAVQAAVCDFFLHQAHLFGEDATEGSLDGAEICTEGDQGSKQHITAGAADGIELDYTHG